ncbi:MAG: hypothetical protein QXK01_08970 [Thermofilum sp.]|uniref:hypothetical protein n=1 Tax=Thermofilum sp. TaxID=1961369 RepID=UPI0031690D8F
MGWEIAVEEIERLWAEPLAVYVYVSDKRGNTYMVHRIYGAADMVLECWETEEDVGCEGTSVKDTTVIEFIAQIVKEIIEWHISHSGEFFATVDINHRALREKIEKILREVKNE